MKSADIKALMDQFSLVGEVDQVSHGHIRIETQLKYPDGTSIEVFLLKDNTAQQNGFRLSDLGQTTAWLLTAQVKPWTSKKRKTLLADIIRSSGVIQRDATLECLADHMSDLPQKISVLAQCCLRVADLTFTKRTALQTVAKEEIEELIADLEISYESDVELDCGNRKIKVDFLTQSNKKNSAIFALSAMNATSAHHLATDIFSKWYDLKTSRRPEQRVTIFDDTKDVYKEADLERLGDLSTVLPLSDRSSLQAVLN